MAKLGEYGDQFLTMSLQEIYSVAREHLLTQMKQSGEVDYHGQFQCKYKGSDDTCCAAAPFIKDYHSGMEGIVWMDIAPALTEASAKDANHLVMDLQGIHDNYPPEEWEEQLDKLAARFNLKPE